LKEPSLVSTREHETMILDTAQFIDDQQFLLPETTKTVSLLQIQTQDAFSEVLDVLGQQETPLLLLLPASGDAFSQPEHFRLLAQEGKPPFLCLVIPPERAREAELAAHAGIQFAVSIEDALQMLVQTVLLTATASGPQKSASAPPTVGQTRQILEEVKTAPLPQVPLSERGAKRQSSLVHTGLLALLVLAASILFVPLMLFRPTSAQPDATAPLGTFTFLSSGQFNPSSTQGYNDIVTLSLGSIPAPPTGMWYYVWLLPDQRDSMPPLLIGTLHASGPVNLTYISPEHTNLLASYNGVRITVQSSHDTPTAPSQTPATWKWQGAIPNIPTPGDESHYSLLDHIRHLLASDPILQANQIPGGLALWLTRNAAKVEEWASAAQGDWHGLQTSEGDADQIHRQMLRILEYSDGVFYYTLDVPTGSPWLVDPVAGKIGLLSRVPNQNPPGLLTHVSVHLTGLAQAPGHTAQQQHLAVIINNALSRVGTDLLKVRTDAARLVNMDTQQLQQAGNEALLDEMVALTTEVKSGWLDPTTGEDVGGVVWIFSRLQQIASFSVTAYHNQKSR
jgi:hypothetical protein